MALAAGARAKGVEMATGTQGHGDRRRRAGRPAPRHRRRDRPRPDRVRDRRQRRRDVQPRDRPPRRRRGAGRADGPPVRHHPPAVSRCRASLPTMRDPDRLVYFREEVGGMIVGGYERNPDPWCADGRIPADFNNRLLDPDWERFAPARRGRPAGRAGARRRRRRPARQRAGGVHARRRVHPRRERGRRPLRGRRVLRPRHRRRRRRRPGHRRVDRRTRAADGPVEDGRPPVRPAVRLAGLLPRPHATRSTARTTTSPTPTTSARPGGRCAHRPRTPGTASSARCSARRAGGSGSTGTPATRTRPTRRCGPAGWAGEHWSTAIVTEALATRHDGGAVRRVQLRQARGERAGRGRPPRSGCAPTASTSPSGRSPTRRCSTGAAASSATSPCPASAASGS